MALGLVFTVLLYGSYNIAQYLNFILSAAPASNPASGNATVYVNSTSNLLSCLLSTGASCLPSASSSTPNVDGTGSAGTSTNYARQDHVHPTDTSRQAALTGTDGQIESFVGTTLTSVNPMVFSSGSLLPATPSLTVVTANQFGLTAGSIQDLYTCPTQTPQIRCYLKGIMTSGSTCESYLKVSGTYFETYNSSNSGASIPYFNFVLEQGQTFSMSCPSTAFSVWLTSMQFNTTSPYRTISFTAFAAGNNTVYTVPSGKHTLALTNSTANFSGSTVSGVIIYIVPSGQTVGSTYQIQTIASFANNSTTALTVPTMSAGDSLVIYTPSSAAGQLFFANIIEF